MKYIFSIDVFQQQQIPRRLITTLTGEVEADRTSTAFIKAWPIVTEQCKLIEAEQNCKICVGQLGVQPQED